MKRSLSTAQLVHAWLMIIYRDSTTSSYLAKAVTTHIKPSHLSFAKLETFQERIHADIDPDSMCQMQIANE